MVSGGGEEVVKFILAHEISFAIGIGVVVLVVAMLVMVTVLCRTWHRTKKSADTQQDVVMTEFASPLSSDRSSRECEMCVCLSV